MAGGLGQLIDRAGVTLTGDVQQQRTYAAIARDHPEASYRGDLARCHRLGDAVVYASAADLVSAWRDAAQELPSLRVQQVVLTETGRQAVNDVARLRR